MHMVRRDLPKGEQLTPVARIRSMSFQSFFGSEITSPMEALWVKEVKRKTHLL